jgi:hypothetical protein
MTTPAPDVPAPDAVDILEEDIVTVPGQAYALVSFVSPDGNQRSEKCGIKIRGCFASRDEAAAHVKKIQRFDPKFDVYLVDMYKWLVTPPPNPSDVGDVEYQEEYLQKLVRGYYENQSLAKQHFEERKASVMLEGLDKNLLPHERIARIDEDPAEDTGAEGAGPSSGAGPSASA